MREHSESDPSWRMGLNEGIIAVATGGVRTCALTTTKQIKCWGDNRFGQLGDAPQEEPRLTPGSAVAAAYPLARLP